MLGIPSRRIFAALVLALLAPAVAFAASPVVPNEPIVPALDRVSWAAVFAGAVVALAIHSALSTLGVGVGAAAVDPYNREHPTKGVPTTILAWMFVSGLVALFAGGWVSGRLAGTVPFDSAIHGVIMWSFATVLLLVFATTTMGAVGGGMFRLLGSGLSGAGQAVGGVASGAGQAVAAVVPEAAKLAKDAMGDAAPQLDWKGIQREARKVLQLGGGQSQGKQGAPGKAGGRDDQQQGSQQQGNQQGGQQNKPQSGQPGNQQGGQGQGGASGLQGAWDDTQDLIEMMTKAYGSIREGGLSNADRDALMTAVTEKTGVSKEDANKTLEHWEKMYREAKQQYDAAVTKADQKARDVAAATKSAVSKVAVWTFASLVVGVTVAAVGGNLGSTYFRL